MNIYHMVNQMSEDGLSDVLYELTVVARDGDEAVTLACSACGREGPETWASAECVTVGVVTSPLEAFRTPHVLCRDSHRW